MFKSKYWNNRGITLIELIVTIAILGIVITAIFSFFDFGNKVFYKVGDQFNTQSNNRLAMTNITQDIQYATEMELLTSIPTTADMIASEASEYYYLYLNGDKIYIYDDTCYTSDTPKVVSGQVVTANSSFSRNGSNLTIQLESIVKNQEYTLDSTIKIPNIDLKSASITGATTGAKAIKYKITEITSSSSSSPVASIEVTPATLSMAKNGVETLAYMILPSDANQSVTWTSSNTSYATVSSNGIVTAQAGGAGNSVIITATSKVDATKTSSCTVSITNTIEATYIELDKATLNLVVGDTATLIATTTPTTGITNPTLTWSLPPSPNNGILSITGSGTTVTITGLVTGGPGTVTVKTSNGKEATCEVTVNTAPSAPIASNITGDKNEFTLTFNKQIQSITSATQGSLQNVLPSVTLKLKQPSNFSNLTNITVVVKAVDGSTATIVVKRNGSSWSLVSQH